MFEPTLIIAGAALVGLTIVAAALLRAWQGWPDRDGNSTVTVVSVCWR